VFYTYFRHNKIAIVIEVPEAHPALDGIQEGIGWWRLEDREKEVMEEYPNQVLIETPIQSRVQERITKDTRRR